MGMKGETAFIVGASRGLGLETADRFLANGANVCIFARNEQLIQTITMDLAGHYPLQLVCGFQIDVVNPIHVQDVIRRASAAIGAPDILVVTAGMYGPMGSLETLN